MRMCVSLCGCMYVSVGVCGCGCVYVYENGDDIKLTKTGGGLMCNFKLEITLS